MNLKEDLENYTSYSLLSVYGAEGNIDFDIEKLSNWTEIEWNNVSWIEKLIIINSKNIDIYFTKVTDPYSIDVRLLREHKISILGINSENKKEFNVYLKDEIKNNSKYTIMMFTITSEIDVIYNISNSIYDFVVNWSYNEIDDIALNSATTPNTWTETWILLLMTFVLSSFIYFKKQIVNK